MVNPNLRAHLDYQTSIYNRYQTFSSQLSSHANRFATSQCVCVFFVHETCTGSHATGDRGVERPRAGSIGVWEAKTTVRGERQEETVKRLHHQRPETRRQNHGNEMLGPGTQHHPHDSRYSPKQVLLQSCPVMHCCAVLLFDLCPRLHQDHHGALCYEKHARPPHRHNHPISLPRSWVGQKHCHRLCIMEGGHRNINGLVRDDGWHMMSW